MYLLPHIETENLSSPPIDGKLFKSYSFCKKNIYHKKCDKFIFSIKDISGFYICPYGFTCYVKNQENMLLISCSIRVKDHFDPKKANRKIEKGESQILSEEFVIACVNESIMSKSLSGKMTEVKEFLGVTLHEIRKLNRDIKSQAEELNIALSSNNANKYFIKYRVQNIFGTSSLISVRLDTFDVLFNPDIIYSNTPVSFYTYKKFEKTMHCLDNACKKKKINFIIQGSNYDSIEAYPVLELLPYVLLENALKYSPEDSEVKVTFESDSVAVENIGPYLSKGEIDKIFERTFRGKHAKGLFSGTGTGLFFAKQVCDIHGINIKATTDEKILYRLNQTPYSNFKMIMKFDYHANYELYHKNL